MKNSKTVFIAIIAVVLALCFWFWFAKSNSSAEIDKADSEIYVFYQDQCHFCELAEEWITTNHPELKINRIDIRAAGGTNKLMAAAGRYKVNLTALGTPFITMGDRYLMGWTPESPALFNFNLELMNRKAQD